ASRMLRTQRNGIPVCVTVSHVDGLVLARCAFRHSLNYRAVMAFGTAAIVEDEREKEAGFNAFIERIYPGRTGLMRPIAPQELKATTLMGMTIEEASAKIRADGPLDLEADHEADCWAGVVPISQQLGAPIPDDRVLPRGDREREIGHFAEGNAFDQILLALAHRYAVCPLSKTHKRHPGARRDPLFRSHIAPEKASSSKGPIGCSETCRAAGSGFRRNDGEWVGGDLWRCRRSASG